MIHCKKINSNFLSKKYKEGFLLQKFIDKTEDFRLFIG